MFLCLYSGGSRESNEELDLEVMDSIGNDATITYIPSCSLEGTPESYYEEFKRYFGYYGIRRFAYFCHDRAFSPKEAKEALSSEAVFLSGGNTFYFRQSLRKAGLDSLIVDYASTGGSLLGLSAGSILMTPSISSAAVGPSKDENKVELEDLSGFKLIDLLFVPHYEDQPELRREIRHFSSYMKNRVVAAVEDGGGMVKRDGKTRFIGPITFFSSGHESRLEDLMLQTSEP